MEFNSAQRNRVFDLKYADDIVLLSGNEQAIQSALDHLAINVSRYGICFAPSKLKVLVQDWKKPAPALIVCGDRLGLVNIFKFLGKLTA